MIGLSFPATTSSAMTFLEISHRSSACACCGYRESRTCCLFALDNVTTRVRSIRVLECQFLQTAQIAGDGRRRIAGRLVLEAHIATEGMRREHLEHAVPVSGRARSSIVECHLSFYMGADRIRDR